MTDHSTSLASDRQIWIWHSKLSVGGDTATLAQAEAPRIKAVANMHGFLYANWTPDGSTGIDQWPQRTQDPLRNSTAPFLRIIGRESFDQADAILLRESKDFSGDFNLVLIRG